MMLTLAMFILAAASVPAAATPPPDTQANCPTYDYSSRFGPVRDQDGHGLCWAFTGAALLEEEACLEHLSSCGTQVSPLDASRCHWHVGTDHEGGQIGGAIGCGLDQGVCGEVDAPFVTKEDGKSTLECFGDLLAGRRDSRRPCFTGELEAFYRRWKNRITAQDVCEFRREPLEEKTRYPQIVRLLHEFDAIDHRLDEWGLDTELDVLAAMTSSKDETEFLRQVLVPPSCQENRAKYAKSSSNVREHFWPAQVMMDRILGAPYANARVVRSWLREALEHGHSAGLSFCTELDNSAAARQRRAANPRVGLDCGAHAIVVNGMRWNARAGRCEVHLRNSWGEGAPYNGWVNADGFLANAFGVTYIQ